MSERSVSRQQQGKRWYSILAPEQFDRAELGTTPAEEPEQVLGRTVETTLGELREEGDGNNITLTFQVTDVGSDAAHTEFREQGLARDYLRSLVRRGSSKVGAVQTVRTDDDYRLSVQPVAFTTRKADDSQEKAIRAATTDIVAETAADHSFEEFIDSVVEGRLSSAIYAEAKTIYPVRRVEIQKTSVAAAPEEVREEEETSVDV